MPITDRAVAVGHRASISRMTPQDIDDGGDRVGMTDPGAGIVVGPENSHPAIPYPDRATRSRQ